MSDYHARIALAREAYQATQPTPSELKAGTARVEAQLSSPARHMRRLMQFLGGGALLGAGVLAALSHAPERSEAGAGAAPDSSLAEPTRSAGVTPSLGLPGGWLQPLQVSPDASIDSERPLRAEDARARAGSKAPAGSGSRGTEAASSKGVAAPGAEAAKAPAPPDWSQVSAALAAGDSAGAGRVLEGLAASGDADTRAKALLGQAQLAFSRGDRAEAKRLTRAAAGVPGASPAVKAKALRWAARASL